MDNMEAASEPEAAEIKKPRFDELGLSEAVMRAVTDVGYETPTEIQARAIPEVLKGRDIIGASQTGTGKTAAFVLPILSRLGTHGKLRCVILEPTRELAQQVYEALTEYGKHTDLHFALLYGGVRYGKQRDQMKNKPDIIVATPGRFLDFYGQKLFDLRSIEHLVLDEADRMLDMGFIPDVRKIVSKCPKNRQSMLFSATARDEIKQLSNFMLEDPIRVAVGGGRTAAETVEHAMYPVDDRQKFDLLQAILRQCGYSSVIIFSRTKRGADVIANWLESAEHGNVAVLHADRNQRERDQALSDFKSGKCQILVATDIAARGIDISDVSHVINYDIPENPEDYVHRIGRTGRMHKSGDAYTLYTAVDTEYLRNIERFIGQEIKKVQLEGFDYNWSPILSENKQRKPRGRNRGYSTRLGMRSGRRRR